MSTSPVRRMLLCRHGGCGAPSAWLGGSQRRGGFQLWLHGGSRLDFLGSSYSIEVRLGARLLPMVAAAPVLWARDSKSVGWELAWS